MFEVGFTEIILILGIALVVLGPEKLPKVAADIGRWVGRARAMARQLRSQLDEEVIKADRDWTRPGPTRKPSRPATGPDPAEAPAPTEAADAAPAGESPPAQDAAETRPDPTPKPSP